MKINLKELNEKGFIFHKFQGNIPNISEDDLANFFISYIKTVVDVPLGESLYYDYDVVNYLQEIKPHYHVIPGSFQVVIWLPDYEFEGRYFLYGYKGELKKYKPSKGMMCFMKPNDPLFLHGVSKLESGKSIKSLGITSLYVPFQEGMNYDIFDEKYILI
jgi:hypothetical protein